MISYKKMTSLTLKFFALSLLCSTLPLLAMEVATTAAAEEEEDFVIVRTAKEVNLQLENDAQRSKIETQDAILRDLAAENQTALQCIDALNGQLAKLLQTEDAKNKESQLAKLEQLDLILNDISAENEEIRSQGQQLITVLNAEIEKLQAENTRLEMQIRSNAAIHGGEIDELTQELVQRQQAIEKLTAETELRKQMLRDQNMAIEQLEEDTQRQRAEKEELVEGVKRLEAARELLAKEMETNKSGNLEQRVQLLQEKTANEAALRKLQAAIAEKDKIIAQNNRSRGSLLGKLATGVVVGAVGGSVGYAYRKEIEKGIRTGGQRVQNYFKKPVEVNTKAAVTAK